MPKRFNAAEIASPLLARSLLSMTADLSTRIARVDPTTATSMRMTEPAHCNDEDRRRRFRFDTADLAATLNGKLATIVDLSLTGIGLMLSESLRPGKYYELRLITEVGELCADMQLVWCHPAFADASWESLSLYRAGFRFPPLEKPDADLLLRLWTWQSRRSPRQPERPDAEITSQFSVEEVAEILRKEAE